MSETSARLAVRPGEDDSIVTDVALLLMVTMWAANLVALKLLLGAFPPPVLAAVRFGIVTVLAFAVLAVTRGPYTIARRDLPRLMLAALMGISIYQVLFMEGLQRTTAFSANVLQGTEPLFALMLVRVLAGETVGTRRWLGVALAFLGTIVFFLQEVHGATSFRMGLGDVLNLVSAFCFALYGLLGEPLFSRYPGRTVMAYTLLFGSLPLLVYAWPASSSVDWAAVSGVAWMGAAASGICGVYVGFWIWNWAISRKGLAYTSLYMFVDVIMSAVFTYILLGERFGPWRIAGTIAILAGLHLARKRPDTGPQ